MTLKCSIIKIICLINNHPKKWTISIHPKQIHWIRVWKLIETRKHNFHAHLIIDFFPISFFLKVSYMDNLLSSICLLNLGEFTYNNVCWEHIYRMFYGRERMSIIEFEKGCFACCWYQHGFEEMWDQDDFEMLLFL